MSGRQRDIQALADRHGLEPLGMILPLAQAGTQGRHYNVTDLFYAVLADIEQLRCRLEAQQLRAVADRAPDTWGQRLHGVLDEVECAAGVLR